MTRIDEIWERLNSRYYTYLESLSTNPTDIRYLLGLLGEAKAVLGFYAENCAVIPPEYSDASKELMMRESMRPAREFLKRLEGA